MRLTKNFGSKLDRRITGLTTNKANGTNSNTADSTSVRFVLFVVHKSRMEMSDIRFKVRRRFEPFLKRGDAESAEKILKPEQRT